MLRRKCLEGRISNSPQDTIDIGSMIASVLEPGDIVYLYGELGSGKTVLVKGICRGLGVKEEVTSSSFVIATEYEGDMPVSHVDLYRLEPKDINALPIEEYILENGLTIIEWADRLNDKHKRGLRIKIDIIGSNERRFTFESPGD